METIKGIEIDEFTRGYIDGVLESLEGDHSIADISAGALRIMTEDCRDFQKQHGELLAKAYLGGDEKDEITFQGATCGFDAGDAGNDFWSIRNGGDGFTDRGLGETGEELSAHVIRQYGKCRVHVSDNQVHIGKKPRE